MDPIRHFGDVMGSWPLARTIVPSAPSRPAAEEAAVFNQNPFMSG